jgi:transmembrane sensor
MTDMGNDADRIAEQAADYFVRRQGEYASERRQRERWLAADARHRRAYDEVAQVWERTAVLQGDPDLQALKARELAALRHSRQRWRGLGLAAALLAVLIGAGYFAVRVRAPSPPVGYATQIGEHRTETLADRTRVVLNTDSAMQVRLTRDRREIDLERGEAQFEVAYDAVRPFVVNLGEGTVTALGTRFQIRRDADAATVTLLEGRVEVTHGQERRVLRPNEQARLPVGGGMRVETIDPAQVSGWLDGWLRFRDTPPAQVVAEANRYSTRTLRLAAWRSRSHSTRPMCARSR